MWAGTANHIRGGFNDKLTEWAQLRRIFALLLQMSQRHARRMALADRKKGALRLALGFMVNQGAGGRAMILYRVGWLHKATVSFYTLNL